MATSLPYVAFALGKVHAIVSMVTPAKDVM
jgi:hypothetical protein